MAGASPAPIVVQETHYDPWGLELAGWYDFHWRQYDPALGRANAVDPHAGGYPTISPYGFLANNPLSMIDPDGRDVINAHADELRTAQTNVRASNTALNQAATRFNVGRNISRKDFLAAGRSKNDWQTFKTARDNFNKDFSVLKNVAENFFEAGQDIAQLRNDHPGAYDALNRLTIGGQAVNVYVGRSSSGHISTAGGAGNEFHQIGNNVRTFNDIGNPRAGDRNGITIWSNRTNQTKFMHEVGHLLSYGGGFAPLGIPAIQFGTANNPQNIFDFRNNVLYRDWMTKDCNDCRNAAVSNFGQFNPTSRAAVLMERVPNPAQPYQRNNFIPPTLFGLMLLR